MYLDVIVIGRAFQEHLLLREVLQWFQEAHLKLNPEKCQLFRRKYGTSGILCHLREWPPAPRSRELYDPEEQIGTRNQGQMHQYSVRALPTETDTF
jgi:hypothetical protein